MYDFCVITMPFILFGNLLFSSCNNFEIQKYTEIKGIAFLIFYANIKIDYLLVQTGAGLLGTVRGRKEEGEAHGQSSWLSSEPTDWQESISASELCRS